MYVFLSVTEKKNETTATGFPVVQTVFDNLLFHCTCCHLINCILFVSDEIRFSAVAKKQNKNMSKHT